MTSHITATITNPHHQTTSDLSMPKEGVRRYIPPIPDDAKFVAEVSRLPDGRYLVATNMRRDGLLGTGEYYDREAVLSMLDDLLKWADRVPFRPYGYHIVEAYCPVVNDTVRVDERMKPLLMALWDLGAYTIASYQDDRPRGYAWIAFDDRVSAELFADLCRSLVKRGAIHIDYQGPCWISVRFPKGKVREMARLLRRIKCDLDEERNHRVAPQLGFRTPAATRGAARDEPPLPIYGPADAG